MIYKKVRDLQTGVKKKTVDKFITSHTCIISIIINAPIVAYAHVYAHACLVVKLSSPFLWQTTGQKLLVVAILAKILPWNSPVNKSNLLTSVVLVPLGHFSLVLVLVFSFEVILVSFTNL